MNISYNWLKEYINMDVEPAELAKILTSIGLETGGVEEVQTIKGGLEGLVVGKVLTCVDHENSDHLHVTTVDVGGEAPLQIVCGAPNVAAGQKVVVATVGTKLYNGDEEFTIKRSKIRGVESYGMICAEDEIGVGASHEGIIVLPDEVPVGTLAKDYYNVKSDYVLEVDITPNRADAISHYGVARDVAAYFSIRNKDIQVRKPSVDAFRVDEPQAPVRVTVENAQACPRYSAVTIAGVTIGESPAWLQERLHAIGVRSINNVVDVANYVMFEMGQALHTFDADKITTGEVRVKNLPEGTPFITLDGVERKLSADDLMICDGDTPMCLAGVFGGLESGISDKTRNVFLESAYFNPVSIRKTARRHGLNTDASFRYERGCDPDNTVYVLKRAALLIQQVAGGRVCGDMIDVYPQPVAPFDVLVSLDKIYKLIGKEIGQDTVETLFTALEMKVTGKTDDGVYSLQVPPYRVDVQRDVDVIEDLLRLYGYNNVELSDRLQSNLSYSPKPDSARLQRLVSEQLTAQGFNEIMNNSLTKSAYYEGLVSFPEARCVRIMNPLSSDLNVMRQTLLFGGLESLARNINHKRGDLKFYEFGNCYFYHSDKRSDDNALKAYSEEFHLGLWLTGNKHAQSWAVPEAKTTVFELKAYVENILRRLGIDRHKLVCGDYADDLLGEALTLYTRTGKPLGVLGIVSPKLRKRMDIDTEVYYADLHWGNLLAETKTHKVQFHDIAKYPEVKRDLALLLDRDVRFADIEKIARDSERNLLRDVYLFDVYEGKNLEAGKKSYAVSFVLQDANKTLTDKQIEAIMKKIQTNLETKLGAKLR